MPVKITIKHLLRRFGYSIQRVQTSQVIQTSHALRNPFDDMRRFTSFHRPIVFDVGANTGQSIKTFCQYLNNPEIHSFEPGEDAFRLLTENTKGMKDVHIVNSAMGARQETRTFVENEFSDMSSFFEPDEAAWGSIIRRRPLQLDTVDDYAARAGMKHIDILKSDTQGYDLNVLRGASKMLREGRISLVYLELIFSKMYQGSPRFDEVYAFLADRGMMLVSFYDMHYQNELLSWTDALFANEQVVTRKVLL